MENSASSSTAYSDLETEELVSTKAELIFEQGSVSQKFTINGKGRKEVHILGKLLITDDKFGHYIEWKPEDEDLTNSTPSSSQAFRPATKQDWAVVNGGDTGISFSVSNEEKIEFIADHHRTTECRRPVKIELAELRSFSITPKSEKPELIFLLADGTTTSPFVFERGSPENLVYALKRIVTIKESKYTKNTYMVTPKVVAVSPQQSIAELILPEQINNVLGFVRDIHNDPKTTAYTALAKIAGYATKQVDDYLTASANASHASSSRNGTPSPASPSSPRHGIGFSGRQNHGHGHSHDGLEADYTTNEEGYEVIFKPEKLDIELGPKPRTFRGQPLSQEQWLDYMDNEGRLQNFEEIKQIIFRGGIDPDVRKHVWGFLLGIYDPTSTYEQRKDKNVELTCSYNRVKLQWTTITEDQEERFHAFRDFKSLIEKDVNRTDRTLEFFSGENNPWSEILRNILTTYVMYHFNVGYVQGMSDILSPILMEMQDEVQAFWLFVKFMERIHTNFEMSQEGMQRQLKESYTLLQLVDPMFSAYLDACDASNMYFAFRWLLILFKREFSTTDILTLWESLWTELPGPSFQIFIGLAILEKHRYTIMENKFGLSEILRHVNDLSLRIDVGETLAEAEALYLQLQNSADKLPNNIRVIIGLPQIEVPAPNPDMSFSSVISVSPEPLNGRGDETRTLDNSREPSPGNFTSLGRSNGEARSPTVEEQSLEMNCEMGISQFY